MLKMKDKEIYFVIVLIIVMFSGVMISKVTANDLFWDLKTGESLLKYGIDFKDHFSWIPNLSYMYHHYLYDLIIYFIHAFFGMSGVFLFFMVIVSLLGISVFVVNYSYTKNKLLSLITVLITLWLCKTCLVNRVQTITYLLFFLEIYCLNNLYKSGKKKYSIFLVILSVLIVNLHMPLWMFFIILILPFLFEMFLNSIIKKYPKLQKNISSKIIIAPPKDYKLFCVTLIILLFSGLISPLKYYPYIFFTKVLGNSIYSNISEMQPTVLLYMIAELVLFIITIIVVFITNSKIKLRDASLLLGLFMFSLMAYRNVIYVYLFYPTILMNIICNLYPCSNYINCIINKLGSKINKTVVTTFLLFLLICSFFFCFYKFDLKNFDYSISEIYPEKTVQYMKQNVDYKNMRLYNDFDYGSYLLYYDIPVFVDSRAEVYISEFNGGKDIFGDLLKIQKFSEYKKIFDKYQFNYALVLKDSQVYDYLMADNEFQVIYTKDKNYVLFQYYSENE